MNKPLRLILSLALSFAASSAPAAEAAATATAAPAPEQEEVVQPRPWNFSDWDLTPVQAGGRVKPMRAFAGEIVLHLTSRRSFEGWKPSEMLLAMVTQPKAWREKPLIKIEREDVKRQLLLDVSKMRFSVAELFGNSVLLQYAQRMGDMESTMAKAPNPNADPREEELKRILDRLTVFHRLITGEAWTFLPAESGKGWYPIAQPEDSEPKSIQQILADTSAQGKIRSQFVALMGSYLGGNEAIFAASSKALRSSIEEEATRLEPAFAASVLPKLREGA